MKEKSKHCNSIFFQVMVSHLIFMTFFGFKCNMIQFFNENKNKRRQSYNQVNTVNTIGRKRMSH